MLSRKKRRSRRRKIGDVRKETEKAATRLSAWTAKPGRKKRERKQSARRRQETRRRRLCRQPGTERRTQRHASCEDGIEKDRKGEADKIEKKSTTKTNKRRKRKGKEGTRRKRKKEQRQTKEEAGRGRKERRDREGKKRTQEKRRRKEKKKKKKKKRKRRKKKKKKKKKTEAPHPLRIREASWKAPGEVVLRSPPHSIFRKYVYKKTERHHRAGPLVISNGSPAHRRLLVFRRHGRRVALLSPPLLQIRNHPEDLSRAAGSF